MKNKAKSLLLWSQKYTKTDMVYLASGGFWLTVTKIAGVIASLFSSVIFANLLSEHDYGVYQYVLAVVSLLTLSTLPGIDTALTRTVAIGNDGTLKNAFRTKVQWGVIGTVASFAISIYYFFNQNEVLGVAFLLVGFFVPFMDSLNVWIAFLSGKKDFKEQTKLQTLTRTGSTIVLILTVILTRDPLVILLMYFISYTSFRFIIFNLVKKKVDKSAPSDETALRYGMHLTFQSLPTIFSKTLDSILVFQMLGGPALAGYSLSKLPMKQFQNLFGSLNILALPKFSTQKAVILVRSLPKKILYFYLIVIPTIVAYWVLAPLFFNYFYPQYTDFIFYSQLFCLQLIWFPTSFLHTALVSLKVKWPLYFHETVTAFIRVALLFLLIPIYGVLGAIVAYMLTTFIGYLILISIFILESRKVIKINNELSKTVT